MIAKSSKKTSAESAPALISNYKLQQIHAAMLKCRILDSHARGLHKGSAWRGKEAIAVGVALDLLPEDTVVSSSDAAMVSFLKGMSLSSILGKSHQRPLRDVARKLRSSDAESAQSALATGIAFAQNVKDSGNITVAFLSENPDSSTSGREALLFAAMHKLPIIYVYNGKPNEPVKLYSYGFPVIPVDGNDAVAVYRVAYECATRARRGGGPSAIAYGFFSANGNITKSQDPVINIERYLTSKGLFTDERRHATARAFEKEIVQAKSVAEKRSLNPEIERASQHVFVV